MLYQVVREGGQSECEEEALCNQSVGHYSEADTVELAASIWMDHSSKYEQQDQKATACTDAGCRCP